MGLEALGAIAGGLNRGMDLAQRDQLIADQKRAQEEQAAAWREDRQFQGSQRSRQIAEQAREDAFRDEWASTPEVGSQSLITGTDVGPTQDGGTVPGQFKTQTAIGRARQQAAAAEKAGKIELAEQRRAWADQKSMEAAAQAYRGFLGSNTSTDPYEFAQGAAKLVTDDQSPVTVSDVARGDDGRVSVRLTNKHNGFSMVQQFGSIDEMRTALQAHYDPAGYDARVKRAQALEDEVVKARAKPIELQPGAQAFDHTGRVIASNTNMTNAEARLAMLERGGAGGTGGAGTGAGKVGDSMKPYNEAFELAATKGEVKLQPGQIAEGQRILGVMARLGHDPGTAAFVAHDAATDPTKTRLEIDHSTGRIDRIYKNPNIAGGRPIPISGEAGTVKDLEKQAGDNKAAIQQDVQTMLGKMVSAAPEAQRPQLAQKYVALASDPAQRNAFLQAQIAAGKSPEAIQNLSRQLELIGTYIKPETKKAPSVIDRLTSGVGGLKKPDAAAQPSNQPSYDELMKAKGERDKLMSDVGRMSPDRREQYLATRLPQIEERIRFHQNYRTY